MEIRRALVTGSAGGIGAATSRALTEIGYDVVGVDVAPSGASGQLCYDLGLWDACLELCAEVGPIDVLVNNAAVLIETTPSELTEREFTTLINVNLRAPFLLSRELSVGMRERGFGRIINVSSIGARTGGVSQSSVYAATKAGLLSLTKHFARTFGEYGVTVNAVAPGAIDTPMSLAQRARNPKMHDDVRRAVPTGRWGTPEEVAAVVSFLASDHAAFVNGVTIDVNGGWVMV